MTGVDCVFGLVMALGAVIGTVIGFVSHPEEPRFDGPWLLVVVPIAASFVGGAIASAFEIVIRRFRPRARPTFSCMTGPGTDPPAAVLLLLGMVSLLAPALTAIGFMLFAAGLVP